MLHLILSIGLLAASRRMIVWSDGSRRRKAVFSLEDSGAVRVDAANYQTWHIE
jgi:hypothetical protein